LPIFEFIIAVVDEPEAHRKQEGDIVAIVSYPSGVGRKTIDEYLYVPFESSLSLEELTTKLKGRMHVGGLKFGIDFRPIDDSDNVDSNTYPGNSYSWDIKDNKPIKTPAIIAKNRYKIPINLLGNLDAAKLANKETIYQPFRKVSEVVAPFMNAPESDYESGYDAKEGKYKITKTKSVTNSNAVAPGVIFHVHASAPGTGEEDDKIFKWDALNDLVFDKFTNSYVLSKDI